MLIFRQDIWTLFLSNIITTPLTPPAELALQKLISEVMGYHEENTKAIVTSLKALSNLSFPADADLTSCMTELSRCLVSRRQANRQQSNQAIQQLQRQLAMKDSKSCVSLANRYSILCEQVSVAFAIVQVWMTMTMTMIMTMMIL